MNKVLTMVIKLTIGSLRDYDIEIHIIYLDIELNSYLII